MRSVEKALNAAGRVFWRSSQLAVLPTLTSSFNIHLLVSKLFLNCLDILPCQSQATDVASNSELCITHYVPICLPRDGVLRTATTTAYDDNINIRPPTYATIHSFQDRHE